MKYALLFSLLLAGMTVFSQDFDRAKMDQYLHALEANDKAMLSLAILDEGQIAYQKTIGYAATEGEIRPDAQTQYRIGSITKVFTTVMIFQLIEEGKLSLESTLSQFFPKVKNAEKITVSHLLSHRSGIFNVTNTADYKTYMTSPKTKAAMLDILEGLGSDFEPGSKASYSNSAFILLGYMIEELTGNAYASELQKRIVNKLGLERTDYGGRIAEAENHARSYQYNFGGWASSFETDMSIPHGAGAIVSTPTDLTRFMKALFGGELISDASLASMKEINEGYGRGLFKIPFYNLSAYGHGGNIDAFDSNVAYFESEDMAFAITANGLDMSMNDIIIGVLSIYFGRPFDIPDFAAKPITLKSKTLTKYEGTFSSAQLPLEIVLKMNGDKLTAQATGQSVIPLTPYSDIEFRYDAAGLFIIFEKKGKKVDYSSFTLKQGGGKFQFVKK